MPGVAFPPVGPVGLSSPPSPVLCSAKTAFLPISGHFAWRSRSDTLLASVRSWYLPRARDLVEAPRPRQGLWSPGPQSGSVTRRQAALPRSRATPMEACPALRPRWCPAHSPKRTQDCCLPATGNRRLPTTLPISGLNHAACPLATPGSVRPLTGRHAGSLLTCWLGFNQVGLAP